MNRKRTFSLLGLFYLVTIAAAAIGLIVMRERVTQAEAMRDAALADRDELWRLFGYIDVDDESKTYFAQMLDAEGETCYRAKFPAGSRYLLHISDVSMKSSKIPDKLPRTKTMSMNGWRDGADVVLKWHVSGGDKKHFVVSTQTAQLFEFPIDDWDDSGGPNEGFGLAADPQIAFNTDEKVILSYFGNEKLERGIVFWLEPHSLWKASQDKRR